MLGSGELGKELVMALQGLGQYVIAVDSYAGAPAMQVAHESEVINMLDGDALDRLVAKHNPDLIVPEIEAIRTERFYEYEKSGMTVVPCARAANFTMNRKSIRDLASKELGLRTATYRYAKDFEGFEIAITEIGFPCVVKPLMSSSGKGQSVLRSTSDISTSWKFAMEGSRGDYKEVIIEGFVEFHSEITLLTVTQKNGTVLFCPPIGHRQEKGDYRESWQPCLISETDYHEACRMAAAVTKALGGAGIWGVEFFLTQSGVFFSELSPRPHDTGMVTLAGTQNLNEFELHARAILGLPIPEITLEKCGASSVFLSAEKEGRPLYSGVEEVLSHLNTNVKIFGKPSLREFRRMGVVLVNGPAGSDIKEITRKAMALSSKIKVMAEI